MQLIKISDELFANPEHITFVHVASYGYYVLVGFVCGTSVNIGDPYPTLDMAKRAAEELTRKLTHDIAINQCEQPQ